MVSFLGLMTAIPGIHIFIYNHIQYAHIYPMHPNTGNFSGLSRNIVFTHVCYPQNWAGLGNPQAPQLMLIPLTASPTGFGEFDPRFEIVYIDKFSVEKLFFE